MERGIATGRAFGRGAGAARVDRDHRVGAPRGAKRLAHRARRQ